MGAARKQKPEEPVDLELLPDQQLLFEDEDLAICEKRRKLRVQVREINDKIRAENDKLKGRFVKIGAEKIATRIFLSLGIDKPTKEQRDDVEAIIIGHSVDKITAVYDDETKEELKIKINLSSKDVVSKDD